MSLFKTRFLVYLKLNGKCHAYMTPSLQQKGTNKNKN